MAGASTGKADASEAKSWCGGAAWGTRKHARTWITWTPRDMSRRQRYVHVPVATPMADGRCCRQR
eukprot:5751367-Prymnesium_polylepis.1